MTTNSPNQGIVQQTGTDPANLPGAQTAWLGGEENRLVQRYTNEADRTARNAAPNEGELSHLAAEDRYEVFNAVNWISSFSRSNFQLVRRTTDAAAINNSTALQSDGTLVTTLPAVTGVYKWRDVIYYSSSQAADFKIAYLFTAGTVIWGVAGLATGATATTGDGQFAVQTVSDTSSSLGGAAVGTRLMAVVEGEIILAGVGTNLTLRYAQQTLDATNTIPAYAGSYRQIWRMS
jgi:hypothetical protein